MSLEVIEKIETISRRDSARVNRVVIENSIPNFRKTFSFITSRTPSGKFFERQQVVYADSEGISRWNVLGKFDWYLSGVYFTNQRKGELIIAHAENLFAWLRAACRQDNPLKKIRQYWRVDDAMTIHLSKARTAYMTHDYETCAAMILEIQTNAREMLEILEFEQSTYLITKK